MKSVEKHSRVAGYCNSEFDILDHVNDSIIPFVLTMCLDCFQLWWYSSQIVSRSSIRRYMDDNWMYSINIIQRTANSDDH